MTPFPVAPPAVFKFSLACDLKQVRQAAQAVHRFLAGQGCDEETLMACDLALVEGADHNAQTGEPMQHEHDNGMDGVSHQCRVRLPAQHHRNYQPDLDDRHGER